jgi:NRPS condensation-like uncharacterized protein
VAAPWDPLELEDSFQRWARDAARSRSELAAYRIPGQETEHRLAVTTGLTPAAPALALAKQHGCSLTELLTAVLILAIADIQRWAHPRRQRRLRPVKICVPINLRKYYDSKTLRNFSSFVNPGIEPRFGDYTLDETIRLVRAFMQQETDEKMLNARFSTNVRSERNPLLRVAPLFVKAPVMKIVFMAKGDKQSSSTLTNLGALKLPPEMARYVARADVLLGALKRNPVSMAVLSFDDTLVINMTRKIAEPYVERGFFTRLVKLGLPVMIESNQTALWGRDFSETHEE